MDKTAKIIVGCALLLVLLLVGYSYSNMGHFALKQSGDSLEIWRGKFAPKGTKLFIALPATKAPEFVKSTYTKSEVFPMVYQYYVAQADTLLNKPGTPDFAKIKSLLEKASKYAITGDLKAAVSTRINSIELLTLQYKAEFAAAQGTPERLEAAISYLTDARFLAPTATQKAGIADMIADVEKRLEAMRKKG